MSGLKKCHFDTAVDRLKDNITHFMELSHEAITRFANLNSINNNTENLVALHDNLNNISFSQTVINFATEEYRQLTIEIEKAKNRANNIEVQINKAIKDTHTVLTNCNEIEIEINNIGKAIAELTKQAQHKIDTSSYQNLSLDNEVHTIDRLSNKLEDKIRDIIDKLALAHDNQVLAQGDLAALEKTVNDFSKRKTQIEVLAERRKRTNIVIGQAQKQASIQNSEEINVYVEHIERIEYKRFMPNVFETIHPFIQNFYDSFSKEDYKQCSEDGPKLIDRLKVFFDELSSHIEMFQEAEQKARNQVKAAQEELASLNLTELKRWSQKEDDIQNIITQFEECVRKVDEISTKGNRAIEFDVPIQNIKALLVTLRKIVNIATDNHARYDARDGVRKAIRNALKELKYDTPVYYFQKELANGSPDELSELTIYAHNPAETGNIRLTIDLDGESSLEVYREDANGNEQEVTHADAIACHNTVLDFGRQLETTGIHMNITDWGKAKDLPEIQEQRRITWDDTNLDKQEKSRQFVHEKIKLKQKDIGGSRS